MKNIIRNVVAVAVDFLNDEGAPPAVEYIAILAGIGLLVIGAAAALGAVIVGKFKQTGDALR